ncbi:Lrp/AsnC family transcriptional regulator [Donghicola eburneus]|uniref:Lrp/AsnC family transcriptional regulator n=1 Tax=Donghicola eburneus TaxID=393278 RepID=UPI0008E4F524|nr:Lrp/AsnC family transcriptional regulator [Donghicola eburneus]SFQ55736.1 DNA-binding transcriptional regulator, Lrp family [Donghicola eburneus]
MRRKVSFDKEGSNAAIEIVNGDMTDPVAAVERVGLNPQEFFEGFDWSDMDFRKSDLSNVSFLGAILDGVYLYEDQLQTVLDTNPKSVKNLKIFSRPPPLSATTDGITEERSLKEKLDPIDRVILRLLQEDGRLTAQEMSKSMGVSSSFVTQRVKLLEDHGLIKGYWADVDAERVGISSILFAMVTLKDTSEKALSDFEASSARIEQVRACSLLNGEIDFLLKCMVFDEEDGQNIIDRISRIDNVINVKTHLAIGMGIKKPGIPLDVLEEALGQRKTSA